MLHIWYQFELVKVLRSLSNFWEIIVLSLICKSMQTGVPQSNQIIWLFGVSCVEVSMVLMSNVAWFPFEI